MNKLKYRDNPRRGWLAMGATCVLLAQGIVLAQTSEDKSQTGQKSSDKMSPKTPGKQDAPTTKPTPKPEPTQPLALTVTTDKKIYAVGTPIKITLMAKNTTPQTLNLNFNNGQKYDFILREGVKPDGKIVWQWSRGRMFLQMITNVKVEAGKSLTFSETYPPKPSGVGSEPLKAGMYTLTAILATFGERPSATTQVTVK